MQNTVVKAFENDPRVVVAVYCEAGKNGEDREWMETFWSHFYLRGSVIFDADGAHSKDNFDQPDTGLPFGRNFVIDQNGNVAAPFFGYDPARVINTINSLLGD